VKHAKELRHGRFALFRNKDLIFRQSKYLTSKSMRYYSHTNSLFIRGPFRAASTGMAGGIRSVPTLLVHAIPADSDPADREKTLDRIIAGEGLDQIFFGATSTVPVRHTCVLQYDFITVFISAGIGPEPSDPGRGIIIIVVSSQELDDAALLETIMVTAEAKVEALQAMNLSLSGTPADVIIAAGESGGDTGHRSAGRDTEAGRRVRAAVLHGIPKAIRRHDAPATEDRPAFFIFSRVQGRPLG
jgi:adenosylcobinamide hydrolase